MPKVRDFFERKAFGQSVDLSDADVVKAMSTPVAHYVCVDVFSKELKKFTIAEQEPTLLEPERLLSTNISMQQGMFTVWKFRLLWIGSSKH